MGNQSIKSLLAKTVPVLAGYIVLGMGFGIIMTSKGFPIMLTVSMSVFIYAGSMQYMAISLFSAGASLITFALTTLTVNARHLFYGISMIGKYKNAGKIKPYLIFGLTDETYSLVCTGEQSVRDCSLITFFDHCYWVFGTALGAVLGRVLPFSTDGLDFALTALFVTIATEQWLTSKQHAYSVTGIVASIICLIIFGSERFLIPAMLLIAVILLIIRKNAEKEELK